MQQGRQTRGPSWRFRRGLHWAAAIAVSGVCLWLTLRQIHWSDVGGSFAQLDAPLLVLGVAAVLATTVTKAARWQLLLRHANIHTSSWRAIRILVIGQMGNSFLPARLGDLARAALLRRQAPNGAAAALGTVAAEKILDGIVGMIVVMYLAAARHLPAWLRWPSYAIAALTAVLLAFLVLALVSPRRSNSVHATFPHQMHLRSRAESTVFALARKRLSDLSLRFLHGLSVLARPSAFVAGLVLSVTVWGLGIATNQMILTATRVHVPIWTNMLVLIAVYLATFLPAAPAQIGVFEYACLMAVGTAAVPAEQALTFGLLLHVVVYAPPALLGPVFTTVEGLRWSSLRISQPDAGPGKTRGR